MTMTYDDRDEHDNNDDDGDQDQDSNRFFSPNICWFIWFIQPAHCQHHVLQWGRTM